MNRIRMDEYGTDNHGLNETWLVLPSGLVVEVSPISLMRNALENLPEDIAEEQLKAFERFLTNIQYDG